MARKLWILYSVSLIVCSVLNIKSTNAKFPKFSIQTNDSFSAVGEKVVIKCFVYNVSLVNIMNGYDITWFKDDVKLTQGYTKLANDVTTYKRRYYISIGIQWGTTVSTVQITNVTKEDEGVFSCELANRMNAKHRKSISIRVGYPEDQTLGSTIAAIVSGSSFDLNKRSFTKWTDTEEDENAVSTPSIDILTKETTDSTKFSGNGSDSNVTISGDSSITIPADNNITTSANSNITTPLLVSADINVENTSMITGIEKTEDNKGGIIAGIILVAIVILVVALSIHYARKRNKLYCKRWYNKTNHISGEDNLTPRGENDGYEDVAEVVSHLDYQNEEPIFVIKNRRRPYEDANDRTVPDEYEFDGGSDVGEKVELPNVYNHASYYINDENSSTYDQYLTVVHSNTSEQNFSDVYRNISEHNLSDALESTSEDEDCSDGQNKLPPKSNKSPYESCNSMSFLKHFKA